MSVVNAIALNYSRAIAWLQKHVLPLSIPKVEDRSFCRGSDKEPQYGHESDESDKEGCFTLGTQLVRVRSRSDDTGADASEASGLNALANVAGISSSAADQLRNPNNVEGEEEGAGVNSGVGNAVPVVATVENLRWTRWTS